MIRNRYKENRVNIIKVHNNGEFAVNLIAKLLESELITMLCFIFCLNNYTLIR